MILGCSSATVKIDTLSAEETTDVSEETAQDSASPSSDRPEDDSASNETQDSDDPADSGQPESEESCDETLGSEGQESLSLHFVEWLLQHPEHDGDFVRADISGGSFGGLISDQDCVLVDPVIFVHGNSDRALGGFGGWEPVRDAFLDAGHRSAELYATTYGPADPALSAQYSHTQEYVQHIRSFIEAVLSYTEAEKVDVIGHSLGVTIARAAIIGGALPGSNGQSYELGPPLTAQIDTFVGIAGANWGMATCAVPASPICSAQTGFYPGWWNGFELQQLSSILQVLNQSTGREGQHIFSIWSTLDAVIGSGCVVWGQNTCRVPGDDDDLHVLLDHLSIRSLTTDAQIQMVVEHTVPQ